MNRKNIKFHKITVKLAGLSAIVVFLLLIQGCYTRFTHPPVSYLDKLGFNGDSLLVEELKDKHTEVRFDDDCKRCHNDFSIDKYYSPNILYSSRTAADETHKEASPWWRKSGYYDLPQKVVEEQTRRSRRSYNRASSSGGGGGSVEYMAPPGVLPGGTNVGSSGSGGSVSAQKGETVALPVRQKDSDKAANSKSDKNPPVKTGDTSSNRRRR